MGEYSVLFVTKLSAKSKKDLERKAEKTAEQMSKSILKPVYAHSYGEIEKKDTLKQTTLDGESR